ncbi:hypothetical protein H311_03457 [Anncaliia algerae PRA109]|nr:hypothetical protein H311_03457 [Anncaliia algerae PRA109]
MKEEDFNDWLNTPIIHKDKIKNFDFLFENNFIELIEEDYYYLTKDFKNIKMEYYTRKVEELINELGITDVTTEIKAFIGKLNKYNELKDIGQALMGKIADLQGITIKDANELFDIKETD